MKNKNIADEIDVYLDHLKNSGVGYILNTDTSTPKSSENEDFISKNNPDYSYALLDQLYSETKNCQSCGLGKTRNKLVYGSGNSNAKLVFVGEAPGRDEDMEGQPFVGRAGKLLTKIIEAINLERADVYICNIIKCRPPENRNPMPEEIEACEPFLLRQLDIIKPRVICALGKFAAQTLLKTEVPISSLRGQFHDYHGIPIMPTYHPAYLMRNPKMKRVVWDDMQMIEKQLKSVD